jgi:hypothetical protein
VPDREAIEAGLQWELDFAARFGGEVTPGSGNQHFIKLDVATRLVLWSAKSTLRGSSYPLTKAEMDEAVMGAMALGGPGVIPGMAVRIGQYDIVAMRADDMYAVLSQPAEYGMPESKAEARRRRALTPSRLRRNDP